MKKWPLAAAAALLILTGGCKTVMDYGSNPGGGGTPGQHPWAAQWKPAAPPPAPVAQSAPPPAAPAPAPAVQVAPAPAPAAAPTVAPEPPRGRTTRAPRRERG